MGMAGNPRPENLPRTCAREDGVPKVTFVTEAEANAYARRSKFPLDVYKCPTCGCWHTATAMGQKEKK